MKNDNYIIFFNEEQAYEAGDEYGQDLADYLFNSFDKISKKVSESSKLSKFREGLFNGFLRRYFQNDNEDKCKKAEHNLKENIKKETMIKNDKNMSIKKMADKVKLLNLVSSFRDYVQAIEDIHTNLDNPYVKLPNHLIAHNLGYDLGLAGCENDYRDRIEGNIENNMDSQEYIMMSFKQGFKQGVINSMKQEEDKLIEKQN